MGRLVDPRLPPPGVRPMIPRLLALDVDGTLLTSDHRLTEATVAEISRVRARGVEVLLATSRGPAALLPIVRELGLLSPAVFVASQGGLTGSFTREGVLEVLDRHPMAVELVRPVLSAAEAAGIAVSWYCGSHWYVSHVDPTITREARIVCADPEVRDLAAESDGPEKVMLIAPSSDTEPLRAIASGLPAGLRAQVSNPTYLEITREDVDKVEAVSRYCQSQGYAARNVVAIGDGPNDVGLLSFAGLAIAPANASPQAISAATMLTTGNDEDGVARALRRLVADQTTA
jgi:Cof subfamily protein (haloacid dehalogenase superfamily)